MMEIIQLPERGTVFSCYRAHFTAVWVTQIVRGITGDVNTV